MPQLWVGVSPGQVELSLFSLSLSLSLSLSDAGHLGGPGQGRGSEMRVGLAEAWQVRSGRSGKV